LFRMSCRAVLVVLLLCVFGSIGHSLKAQERDQFREFVTKFNKEYTNNATEYERRFQIFQQNLIHIRNANARQSRAKMGVNKFTDMTREEFSKKLLPQKTSGAALANSCLAKGVTAPKLDPSALPTSFDWRTKNVVTPVKDQGMCGSCWAFSTIGTIESQWAIKGNKLTQFSEQLFVDCSHGCSNEPPYGPVCNSGCDGGWQWNAYSDVMTWGGVETETQYPYTGETDTCNMKKNLLQAKVSNYTCLSNQTSGAAKEDQMAALLYSHGPLAIAMDADILQYYYEGIVDPWFPEWECDPTVLDHALLLVGWGEEDSEIWGKTPYWIVKNSWGADWGESGYFRIIRGTSACGINNAVSSVIL